MAGGHEMVAAFQFKSDHSFEFYFIYGAVDRHAKGTYEIKDNQILLHADKKPGHDFTVLKALHQGDGTTGRSPIPTRHCSGILPRFLKREMKLISSTAMKQDACILP